MNWPAMKIAMAALVSELSGVPVDSVVWRGTPQARSVLVGTRIVMRANGVISVGVDETLTEPVTDRLDPQRSWQCGQRRFTWSIMVETQQTTANDAADVVMDRIRTRMRRPTSRAKLNAVGIAIGEIAGTASDDALMGGRTASWAMTDFIMNSIENDVDTSIGAGDWIGDAVIDSDTINDAAGPVAPQLHLDVDARNA